MNTKKKLLGSFAALGAAASIAGLGTFASFTSSTTASQSITAGTVSITLGASGPANRLAIGATNLVPGDTIQRAVDLINNGTATSDTLSSIQLTTTAAPSSPLDTDPTNPLQMVVDRCSVAWTESASPPYTYTCSGTPSQPLAPRAAIGANLPLTGLSSLTNSSLDHLRVTLTLPAAAGNNMQGQTSTISYNFVGTQRLATSK